MSGFFIPQSQFVLKNEFNSNSCSEFNINAEIVQIPKDRKVYITINPFDKVQSGIVQELIKQFSEKGINTQKLEFFPDKYLNQDIPDFPDAGGLIIVQPFIVDQDHKKAMLFLRNAFCLVQKNAPYIMASAEKQAGFITSISFLGGCFGFDNAPFSCSGVYGGIAGLIKTAGLEFKNVLCRAMDLPFDPKINIKIIEAAACLSMTKGPVEIGLSKEGCHTPVLKSCPVVDSSSLNISSEDVIFISGGARGVTAQCAIALSKSVSCTIILSGRSEIPFDPPEWSFGVTDPGELKKLILSNEFSTKKPSLSQLEKRYRKLIANREILETLEQIQANGSKAVYLSCDVTDTQAVAGLFEQIQQDYGYISGIIHGAGVIHDKQIVDKKIENFDKVLSTKIDGLCALMAAAKRLPLKYLVLFSSVAGRSGNPGQADYAMANEVLNKMAWDYARTYKDCSIISINWGPWAGGMVTDSLKKNFEKRGINLIPLLQGSEQMLKEMIYAKDSSQREVVIGAQLTDPVTDLEPESKKYFKSMLKVMTQICSLEHFPILRSHIIDQTPVIPLALIIEFFAHGAEKNNPGLICAEVNNVRLFKGILLTEQEISLDLFLSSCSSEECGLVCQAEIRSQNTLGQNIVHASALCILKDKLPAPPVLPEGEFFPMKKSKMTPTHVYEDILFHGKGLQCITNIAGISSVGIEIETKLARTPDTWMNPVHAKNWTIDPLIVDAAFQAVIIWCKKQTSQVCLPGFVGILKRYSHKPSSDLVKVIFKVKEQTRFQIKGDILFVDLDNTPFAVIKGFEAIVDPGLSKRFKPSPLKDKEHILSFAQGNPSHAFGDKYSVFDSEKQIARLPRPPYLFMDQVLAADHPQWFMERGGWVRSKYHVPENAWYFAANHTKVMPFAILLEIALQPCGWLAAWAGSALHSSDRLYFRNLGGKGKIFASIESDIGTITVLSRMTDVSQAGGMIIQNFDMEVSSDTALLYKGKTNFGFFSGKALANQVGIKDSVYCKNTPIPGEKAFIRFTPDAPLFPDDFEIHPDTGMPAKALRMIDAIDILDFDGGIYGKGYIQAHKIVDPDEWFFKAHFYQDPVCPGSLGVESFLQMLRFFLKEKYKINLNKYQVNMTNGQDHEWVYRGQIIPSNKKVVIHAHILDFNETEQGYEVTASGALVVDGITIYEINNFSIGFFACENY